jgi:hypothetical protein
MTTRKEQSARIAVTDESGSARTVDEFTTSVRHAPISGPEQWIKGTRSWQLGGQPVNKLDDTTFEIAATGERLTRV